MSSTNRGSKRSEADNYKTPKWCVRRLMENYPMLMDAKGPWLEPCAGTGDIIEAVREYRPDVKFDAIELRKACAKKLGGMPKVKAYCPEDFLDFTTKKKYPVTITNPPFRIAQEVLERSLTMTTGVVVLLLRLNYVGSEKRWDFMSSRMANEIKVLPNRPPFARTKHGKWGTDSIEYAWFCWYPGKKAKQGMLTMLPLTPLEERKMK